MFFSSLAWRGVAWRGVAWRGVAWRVISYGELDLIKFYFVCNSDRITAVLMLMLVMVNGYTLYNIQ